MSEKVLSIVIPTKGSPNYIDFVFDYYNKIKMSQYVDIYVCDASTDNSIKCVVEKYNHLDLHINYCHVDDMGFDQQTLTAIRLPKTNYIWLCGHGVLIREELIKSTIEFIKNNKYDLYITVGGWIKDKEAHQIPNNDNGILMKYWFANLTMYGGSILSKSLIDRIEDSVASKYWGTYFGYTCNIFEYLDSPYYLFDDTIFEISEEKMRKGSFWTKGNIVEMWSKNYASAIDLLPDKYKEYKAIAKLQHTDEIMSKKTIMYYRTNGNYTMKHFFKFKKWLIQTTDYNAPQLFLIALVPCFVFRSLYYIRHKRKPWKTSIYSL